MLLVKHIWIFFGICLILSVLFLGCGFRAERPVHRDKVEFGKDAKGRVLYQKFNLLVDDYNGSSLATITQHFDTTGRIVSEFGTDHPRLGKQYLYEIFYEDSMRVINYFRWPDIDTSNLDFVPPAAFVEQKILIDSGKFLKTVIITKVAIDKNIFVARYFEDFPSKKERDGYVPYSAYTFNMPLRNFVFDNKTRLMLKDISIVKN